MKQLGFIGTHGAAWPEPAQAGFGLVVNDIRREVARPLEEQGAVFAAPRWPRPVSWCSPCCPTALPCATWPSGTAASTRPRGARGPGWISAIDKKTVVDNLKTHGWRLLDASGGVEEQAAAAALSIWASGPRADENMPVFQAMGNKIVYMGELGNAKLAANAMLSGIPWAWWRCST